MYLCISFCGPRAGALGGRFPELHLLPLNWKSSFEEMSAMRDLVGQRSSTRLWVASAPLGTPDFGSQLQKWSTRRLTYDFGGPTLRLRN